MASNVEIREKAIDLSRRACDEDRKENYEEAYNLYKQAIKYFMHLRRFEQNPMLRQNFEQKATEYLNRAEQIKEFLEGGTRRQPVLAGGHREETKRGGPSNGGSENGTPDDENAGLKKALESAIITEKPNVKWSDVAGLENAKAALQEAVILPTRFPELFVGKRTPWKGILLYGPPGTGKSHLARACATEADATFFSVSSSDLVSKYMGESERLVRSLFEMARASRPAIIFIDEIDSLCGSRGDGENDATRRIKTEFLVQMNGVGNEEEGILVLGATNIPWGLDSAIRRRFELRIYIPLPEFHAREVMFKIHIGDTPNDLTDDDFESLGRDTEGFSGSDINTVVKSALMEPVRRCHKSRFFKVIREGGRELYAPCPPSDPGAREMSIMDVPPGCLKPPDVCSEDFYKIIDTAKPSVSEEDLVRHEEFTRNFGQEG